MVNVFNVYFHGNSYAAIFLLMTMTAMGLGGSKLT